MPAAERARLQAMRSSRAALSHEQSGGAHVSQQSRGGIRATVFLVAVAAIAFALSFPHTFAPFLFGPTPWNGGWSLSFVWPALLAIACRIAPSARVLALCVFVSFGCAFLAHEWWMHTVTALGMPVLVVYLAAWTVVLALGLRALLGPRGSGFVPCVVALPLALVAIEFLRGDVVCSGYAWFFAAHPMVEWPAFVQVASLGGGWLVTALVAVVAGGVVDGLLGEGRLRLASPVVALLLGGAAVGWGHVRLNSNRDAGLPRWEALIVQTNLPMSNKLAWAPEAQIEDFRGFAKLTVDGARRAFAEGRSPAVAIWPETTVPGFGFEPESIGTLTSGGIYPGDRFLSALMQVSEAIGRPMLVGSPAYTGLRVEDQRFVWDRQFNSAYIVDGNGVGGRTDKIFLTPFGETMPIISRWDWLEARLLDLGAAGMTFDLEEADAPRRFTFESASDSAQNAGIRVGVPICFEITAPWASRRIAFDDGRRQADILVNISNDGWFGPSDSGRRQHVQVAQLRAVELATPVIRCANTGFSCSIDRFGRIGAMLPAREAATMVVAATPAVDVPLAAEVGDLVAWASLFFSSTLTCFGARRVRRVIR